MSHCCARPIPADVTRGFGLGNHPFCLYCNFFGRQDSIPLYAPSILPPLLSTDTLLSLGSIRPSAAGKKRREKLHRLAWLRLLWNPWATTRSSASYCFEAVDSRVLASTGQVASKHHEQLSKAHSISREAPINRDPECTTRSRALEPRLCKNVGTSAAAEPRGLVQRPPPFATKHSSTKPYSSQPSRERR